MERQNKKVRRPQEQSNPGCRHVRFSDVEIKETTPRSTTNLRLLRSDASSESVSHSAATPELEICGTRIMWFEPKSCPKAERKKRKGGWFPCLPTESGDEGPAETSLTRWHRHRNRTRRNKHQFRGNVGWQHYNKPRNEQTTERYLLQSRTQGQQFGTRRPSLRQLEKSTFAAGL